MRASTPPTPAGYELVRPVGHGASSVVWQATQRSTRRPVALKILDADVSDAEATRRFEREREVMGSLAVHPGIVTIHDAGVQDGRPWLAMELCRRGSLNTYTTEHGPLDPGAALAVLVRIADALAAAHAAGVLHCDVKPANIMLTDHGEPALGDFGIARVTVGRATTTTVGGFSLDHVAPELLDEEKSSAHSDVYSLGTTTWELLAGYPPFRRHGDVSVGTVIKRIMTQPVPELPDSVPSPVLELLREMTAKDPAERVASAAEVARRARELARSLDLPLHTDLALAPLPALDPPVGTDGVEAGTDDSVTDGDLAYSGSTVHRRRPVADGAEAPPPAAPRHHQRRGLVSAAVVVVVALLGTIGIMRSRAEADPAPQVDVLAQSVTPTTAVTVAPTTTQPATALATTEPAAAPSARPAVPATRTSRAAKPTPTRARDTPAAPRKDPVPAPDPAPPQQPDPVPPQQPEDEQKGPDGSASAKTYTRTRTVGPYSGTAPLGQPGALPDGDALVVVCDQKADTAQSGSATINVNTSHGTSPKVLTVGRRDVMYDSDRARPLFYAWVEQTGQEGWNSVTLSVTCLAAS